MPRTVEQDIAIVHQTEHHSSRARKVRQREESKTRSDELPTAEHDDERCDDWEHPAHPITQTLPECLTDDRNYGQPHHSREKLIEQTRFGRRLFPGHQRVDKKRNPYG